MTNLTLYRILTFILLPFALLLGGIGFFMLLMALANPQLLLQVFMVAAFVIYTFASMRLLGRHIEPAKPAKTALRDWIRVNGVVTGVMALSSLLSFVSTVSMSPAELKATYDRMAELQPQMPTLMNANFYASMMKVAAYVSLVFGATTLTHIVMSFRLLKKYAHLFRQETE